MPTLEQQQSLQITTTAPLSLPTFCLPTSIKGGLVRSHKPPTPVDPLFQHILGCAINQTISYALSVYWSILPPVFSG